MTRGSFEDECWFPTTLTCWVLLPGQATPIPYDTFEEALEVITLETLWQRPARGGETVPRQG